MNKRVGTGREFWQAVLLAGGASAIPRWTLDPAPGAAEQVATLDDHLVAAVRRLADGLQLPLHSVVPAELFGEHDVVTGYAAGPGGRPLPCRPTTKARSWRSLLPVRPLLRGGRHVPVGREARDRPGPGGLPQGHRRASGPADMAELLHREHAEEPLASADGI